MKLLELQKIGNSVFLNEFFIPTNISNGGLTLAVEKVVVGFANKYLSSRILGKVLPPVGDTSIVLTLFLSGRSYMEYRQ
jgi:hypothetical protein